jgi:hypothetical protein
MGLPVLPESDFQREVSRKYAESSVGPLQRKAVIIPLKEEQEFLVSSEWVMQVTNRSPTTNEQVGISGSLIIRGEGSY